jgi:hypothetical protein
MSEINEIKDDNKIKVELLINTAINEFNLKEYKKSIDLFDQVIRIDSKILDVSFEKRIDEEKKSDFRVP